MVHTYIIIVTLCFFFFIVVVNNFIFSLAVGPILVVEPRPVTVDVDSDVSLNCKWSGNPPLTLTWTKKGSSMVSAHRVLQAALTFYIFYFVLANTLSVP